MRDHDTTLAEIKQRLATFVAEREWDQFHAPKNLAMALAAEAAELMEHFLWEDPADSRRSARDPAKRTLIEEELADVVIYALEFANVTDIDMATAIERKLRRNAERYPVEKVRGNARKYNEL